MVLTTSIVVTCHYCKKCVDIRTIVECSNACSNRFCEDCAFSKKLYTEERKEYGSIIRFKCDDDHERNDYHKHDNLGIFACADADY